MKVTMRQADFIKKVERYRSGNGQRIGQAMYNTLADCDPALARLVCSSNIDPYYDNNNISQFLVLLHNKGFITFTNDV